MNTERTQDEVDLAIIDSENPFEFPADDEIEWAEVKTESGATFRCGVRKSELAGAPVVAVEDASVMATRQGAEPRTPVNVYWPVQNDNYWRVLPPNVASSLSISRYALVRLRGSVYDYRLHITNTAKFFFAFKDQSGDEYPLWTVRNGDHYIDYSSSRPTIIRARW